MFHIALYQPEIPPNTGNIIRLCANAGAQLHLIGKLGFTLEDKQLKRAGLDYHEYATLKYHEDFSSFLQAMQNHRIFACTTKTKQRYTDVTYQANDVFLFGPETSGLPANILSSLESTQIRIPMLPHSRSLNLSNAAAVILFEAWRQQNFQSSV